MDALALPLTPGSTTAILHPINVFNASWAILRHALSSLNPDSAIVRRTHHTHRTRSRGAATESRAADTASIASSHGSRRSNTSSAVKVEIGVAADSTVPSSAHRHHRTRSGEQVAERRHHRRHHHRTPSLQGSELSEIVGSVVTEAAQPSSARRTRSAEDPLAAARRAAGAEAAEKDGKAVGGRRVRRSHSDGVRRRSSRHGSEGDNSGSGSGSGNGSAITTPRLSTPHALSPAATAAAASGLTPPLAPPPPPPMSRGLGKPPLSSSRLRSTSQVSDGDVAAAAAASRHRSGSGRSARSRRGGDVDEESNKGSVIVIQGGTGVNLGGWPFLASLVGETDMDRTFSWSPRVWWNRLRTIKVTRVAFLINHVLHAVPVMVVHYCCELKRQLVTLPLLRFSDLSVKYTTRCSTPAQQERKTHHAGDAATVTATPATTSTHHDLVQATEWPPTEEAFERLPPATVVHLLWTRWLLQAVESFIEKLFFFDETLVVRQLRSKRTLRRVVGWSLRVLSHTVFDPFLLSIVIPVLLSSSSADAATAGSSDVPQVIFTVPGMVRGFAISAVSVVVQWIVMPTASRLVYRAVLTVFEVLEYLVMRRYAHWSDEEDDDEDDEDDEEGDNLEDAADDGASLVSGVSGMPESRSVSQQSTTSNAAAAGTAEDRIRREQRHLRRERRERRKRREQRRAAREQATRRTILRAIVYRVVSSVVAQSLVDHPLSVLVELLRGRATLHLTGMLAPYATMTAAQDELSWKNMWRYAQVLTAPSTTTLEGKRGGANEEEDGIPPIVIALRRIGRDTAHELRMISSSVLTTSGQRDAIAAVEQRAAEKRARGEVTSAADSAEFLMRSALSLSPFYYGLQFTVMDKVLTFYMAVWTRLTKQ
jgi:hypothetical protein